MKLHRFYIGEMPLTPDLWIENKTLLHQWVAVLRFDIGRELVLFNDERSERLYKIVKIDKKAAQLELVTELSAKLPKREVYLCFSLLKKDKNDWVLQKATELGVRHFIPLLSARTEKTGFDVKRAKKIVIEASEQCGRTDIPRVREPLTVERAVEELSGQVDLYIAEQGSSHMPNASPQSPHALGVLVGPEGGWSEDEKRLFAEKKIEHLSLSEFTLRAETAAITAAALLQ